MSKFHFPLAARMDAKLAVMLVLTALVPLTVAGYFTLHFATQTLRQEVMSNLQVVADSKVQRIEGYLLARVGDVTVQSRSRMVQNLTERLSAAFHRTGIHSPEYGALAASAREHFTRYAQPEYYDNVLLIDPGGNVVFSLVPSGEFGVDLQTAAARYPALARLVANVDMLLSGEISDYEMDAATGEKHAYVAAPIFKNGVFIGVLAFRIDNRDLFEIAGDYTGLGETGETVIGRREGGSILMMTPTRHDPAAAFRRRVAVDSPNGIPTAASARGDNGIGQARDYRGVETLAVWKYLPVLRCGLVVKIDEVEAFAPIHTLRQAAFTLGGLVALLVMLAAPWVARNLAAPIRSLAETTRAFSAGDLTRRASIPSSDEIGNLAAVFNQMADTIQQQIAGLSRAGRELELRVEERTADLEKANLALQEEVAGHRRAEESLRESEERFASAFEDAPIGVALASLDGHWLKINRELCELVGYSKEELLALTFQDITHPEDLEADLENVRRLLAGEIRSYQMEKRYIHKQGHIVPILLNGSLVRDAQGQPRYFIGHIQDISERKQAEESLAYERDLLRALLDNSPDHIYFKDLQSRFVKSSKAHARLFGANSPEELVGRTDFDFFSEEHARPAYEAEQEVIRTGRAILNLEEKETHLDGSITWASTSKIPWRDKTGAIIGTMGISRDITERKQIEQALSLTLERLQVAVKAGKAGTWDYDLLTGKVDWDDQMLALYGKTASNVPPGVERWYGVMHPDDMAQIAAIHEAAQQGARSSFDTEFRIYRGDNGALRHIRTMGVVLRDDSGRPVRMTGVNWDVTEERIREKKLAESLAQEKELAEKAQAGSRAKSEFLAVMSHEIRTPMNGILGFSELLAAAPNLPDDCRDYVKTIASSGEALLRIIDDILDFSRLEAGGLKIEPTLFSTREILQDVRTLLAPRASEKHLEFLLAVEDGVPEHLWNDAGRLRQILINLAGNALKFTAHGSITLGLRPARSPLENGEPAAEFFVRDTGMGIPPDKLAHVFEPFAQADSSISRRYGGTGLGLAISRNLVELMGGKLSVQSKVGEGSEFAVTLPLDMPQGAARPAQDSGRKDLDATFATCHPLRILLVDDDPVNLKLMLIMLRKLGYEPLTARDGVEAVEIHRRERPDCILMDLQMPRKGGLQATIEIREMENAAPGGGYAYIAALTADIVEEDRLKCFEAGMDAHMTKPVKRAVLAQNLERACEKKPRA